jgi:hypothetical protein
MKNDRSYFLKREAEERSAAQRAEGKARLAHSEMAEIYRQLSASAPAGSDVDDPEPVSPA